MHAFVTGGTGFLGANLIEQLLAEGWQVTAMYRPGSDTRLIDRPGVAPVEAALDDIDSLRAALPAGVDGVFHVAGNTSMWRGGNAQQWRDNVEGTANVARVAREKGAGRMVVTSSISAYGYHTQLITEESPQLADDPRHHYLYSKKRAEQAVREEARQGLDAVFLNPCAIVGKYDTGSWAQAFYMIAGDRLPGVPPGAGSFCHAAEVARAHISAFHRGRSGENYILAGTDATFLDFFATIARLVGKPAPRRTTPAPAIRALARMNDWVSRLTGREPAVTPEKAAMITRRVTASSAKACRELGYRTDVELEQMLTESRDWLLGQGLLSLPQTGASTGAL